MATVTADDRRRIMLPGIKPGDRFDFSTDSEGRIVLRPLVAVPADIEKPVPIVRLKTGPDGFPFFPVTVEPASVVKAIREGREERRHKYPA